MTYREELSEWCRRQYERTARRPPKVTTDLHTLPKGVLVPNYYSHRALFKSCLIRRRGYILDLPSVEFSKLPLTTRLTEQKRKQYLERWVKGVAWLPAYAYAKVTEEGWVIQRSNALAMAQFLTEQGQSLFKMQLFEEDDVPATKANLELLFLKGLGDREGNRVAIVNACVTY